MINWSALPGAITPSIERAKPSFWKKLGTGLSSFQKEYAKYPPQNKPAGQQVTNFAGIPIKKNNVLLYVGLGGIALVAIYLIMK